MTVIHTDSTLHDHTADTATTRRRSPWRAWSVHLAEMMIAMIAGMVVLGGALEGMLSLAGASLADASANVIAGIMAFNMTVPMVWWMHYRGHGARHNVEMAGSMIVPTLLAIVLNQAGAIADDAVLAVQHLVMIPAMVGVMLWRYDHYSH